MVETIGTGSKTAYVTVEHSRSSYAEYGSNIEPRYPDIETIMVIDGVRIKATSVERDTYSNYDGHGCSVVATFHFICKFEGKFVEKRFDLYYPGSTSVDVFGRTNTVADRMGMNHIDVMIFEGDQHFDTGHPQSFTGKFLRKLFK